MKTLFVFVLCISGAVHANTPVTCDVRQWGNGREVLNQKAIPLILNATEDEDISADLNWQSGVLSTPVGSVTVSYDQKNISLSYNLKLGNQAGTMIAEGSREAKMTVFLGPAIGDNNGLSVSCKVSPKTAPTSAPQRLLDSN